jgi:hypothetical protein
MVASVDAIIVGGWRRANGGEGHFGVKLDLPVGDEVEDDESSEETNVVSTNDESGGESESHYTDSIGEIQRLKREGRDEQAIALLLQAVDATERESQEKGPGWGVAPWYYEQLAVLYRKEKRFADEVAILERYAAQEKAPGVGPQKLAERLEKAKALLLKKNV